MIPLLISYYHNRITTRKNQLIRQKPSPSAIISAVVYSFAAYQIWLTKRIRQCCLFCFIGTSVAYVNHIHVIECRPVGLIIAHTCRIRFAAINIIDPLFRCSRRSSSSPCTVTTCYESKRRSSARYKTLWSSAIYCVCAKIVMRLIWEFIATKRSSGLDR